MIAFHSLLADQDGSVARRFGVPVKRGGRVIPRGVDRKPLTDANGEPIVLQRDVTLDRWTFVIDQKGQIIYKNTQVNPARDSQQILGFLSDESGGVSPESEPADAAQTDRPNQ